MIELRSDLVKQSWFSIIVFVKLVITHINAKKKGMKIWLFGEFFQNIFFRRAKLLTQCRCSLSGCLAWDMQQLV